ncbi:MAG TPA: hypothetical protein VNV25_10510 [Gemmatimonadaceae bacterium]|nr:hypothetical protein [Gemmatimonadaceae bacterium]
MDEPHGEHRSEILDIYDPHLAPECASLEHAWKHHPDAVSSRDERELELGASDDDARHECAARRRERVAQDTTERAAVVIEHPRQLRQILEAHALGERKIHTGDDGRRIGGEGLTRAPRERLASVERYHRRGVERATAHRLDQRFGPSGQRSQVQLRVGRPHAIDRLGEREIAERGGDADAEITLRLAVRLEGKSHVAHGLHDAACLIVGGPARGGEPRRLRAAVEQGSADRLLERLNPTRHARLREVQSERRAAD